MSMQEIRVDALGRAVAAYDESEPVSLKVLGKQRIERFSLIQHDADEDGFIVMFDRASPYRAGRLLRVKDFEDRGISIPVIHRRDGFSDVPIFDTYADAVKAERAVLSAMLARGEI